MDNIHIKSIEASQIYNKTVRDIPFTVKYIGMLPASLQSLHLSKLKDFRVKKDKHDKLITSDIINIKFNNKDQNIYGERKYLINKKSMVELRAEQTGIKSNQEYINSLDATIAKYDNIISTFQKGKRHNIKDIPPIWQDVSTDKLRQMFCDKGFILSYVDKKTGELIETHYTVYQRSGSKSRTGQVLFIKDSLYQEMHTWSRMGLQFDKSKKYETFTNLLPYEALTASSIEGTVTINPNNIFVIDDIDSIFPWNVNLIEYNNEIKSLDSIPKDNYMVKNSLFDGESLLERKYFNTNTKGQQYAFMLLRNHFTKTAAFNTNIQLFLQEHCPKGISYDEWVLHSDISGNILAKDIHMITTPNSLKFFKFCKDFNMTKSEMWEYWKSKVNDDACVWGICKHEKQSKLGTNWLDEVVQQTSYQMINSIPFTKNEVKYLSQLELQTIYKLKNSTNYYLDHLKDTANKQNYNEMVYDLAQQVPKFIDTDFFRDVRKTKINTYVEHCKKGKIRLHGDYCVLFGNPLEMLYSTIGVDVLANDYNLQIKDNEIYTKLHEINKEYVMFRSPHTSPSNVLVAKNMQVSDIDKYFNLTNNIVCVNAIKFPIQDILSSCDYDSDAAVIFDNPTILQGAKRVFGVYRPCVNGIKGDDKPYFPTVQSMAEIDNKLCKSQLQIGTVVNKGQHILSAYWHNPQNKELLKKVDIATILSCVCIDAAKKQFKIDIPTEVDNLTKGINVKKSEFMLNMGKNKYKVISIDKTDKKAKEKQQEKINSKYHSYDCPMQYLDNIFSHLGYAKHQEISEIPLSDLLRTDLSQSKADRHKRAKIIDKVDELSSTIKKIHQVYDKKETLTEDDIKEKYLELDIVVDDFRADLKSTKKMSAETMLSIVSKTLKDKNINRYKVLNTLYIKDKDTFLDIFTH